MGIAMVAMIIRCFDGSYEPGGIYHDDLKQELQPFFGTESYTFTRRMLPFLCMVFQSWVMHYNTPRFYVELKDASIPRFAQVVGYAFGLAASMYICIAAAGFWTFGGNSRSYILNNYSPNDPLATLSRMEVFVSTLLIYPLAFIGVLDACLDIFRVPLNLQTTTFLNSFTIALLTVLTILAIFSTIVDSSMPWVVVPLPRSSTLSFRRSCIEKRSNNCLVPRPAKNEKYGLLWH